jgi:energy-coupling factor transport system permease protein
MEPASDRTAMKREAWAPPLLGALAGSLVAGRFATAIGCAAIGAAGAIWLGAPRPRPRWMWMLLISMASAIALNTYLVAGHRLPLPPLLGAVPTAEGLRLGALLALRLLGAALAMHALAAMWPAGRAADEVAGWLRPFERIGMPVGEARQVLALALRFVPLLGAEGMRIARVQSLRAGRAPRGWRERMVRLRARAVPALVGALERAERVALALDARHHRDARPQPIRRPRAAVAAGWAVLLTAALWRG